MSNKIKNILIIGGDERQKYLCESLNSRGYSSAIHTDGNLDSTINNYDAVILPMPLTKDGIHVNMQNNPIEINSLFKLLPDKTPVFIGLAGNRSFELNSKFKIYDYSKRDELSIKNAIPTAEGVIKIVIDNLKTTIFSSKILITGFGKTAKAVAKSFYSLGAEVTICARKAGDLAYADTLSYKAMNFEQLNSQKNNFDVLINTVPSTVITKNVLETLPKDCLLIEIASAPYGIDFSAARDLNMKVIVSGSLPGKIAPKTAGYIISEAICNIIKEENL